VKPYYQQDGITIYHGDCRDLCHAGLIKPSLIVTDPPFDAITHAGARTGSADRVLVDFASVTQEELLEYFKLLATVCSGWQIAFVDWRHVGYLEAHLPKDVLELVRFGVWVKPNGMPQYSGDRPAMGWEAIAFMHPPGKKKWNGGGRSSVFTCNFEQDGRVHPTQKPLPLVGELLNLFANPGDLVFDPFMGSGTTLMAAKLRGINAIGCEIDESHCEAAASRLAQQVFQFA